MLSYTKLPDASERGRGESTDEPMPLQSEPSEPGSLGSSGSVPSMLSVQNESSLSRVSRTSMTSASRHSVDRGRRSSAYDEESSTLPPWQTRRSSIGQGERVSGYL